jgi:hypothetical protein
MDSQAKERLLCPEGVFDVSAAMQVRDLVACEKAGSDVCLDLSRVRECHDAAIALLARSFGPTPSVRFAVRGLRQHQLQMLRYLGLDLSRAPAPPHA